MLMLVVFRASGAVRRSAQPAELLRQGPARDHAQGDRSARPHQHGRELQECTSRRLCPYRSRPHIVCLAQCVEVVGANCFNAEQLFTCKNVLFEVLTKCEKRRMRLTGAFFLLRFFPGSLCA